MTPNAPEPLRVESIRVRADRIEIQVGVQSERHAYTDAALMKRVLKDHPSLALHACRNHKGTLFSDVMNNTAVPHLLEHMVVDGQTRAARDEQRVFTGTTQWDAHDLLKAHVVVSYEDDLVALRVLSECVSYLNEILSELRG